MKKRKAKSVVLEGKIVADGIPAKQAPEKPAGHPLRGLPIRYDEPFLPAVPESDWDALTTSSGRAR